MPFTCCKSRKSLQKYRNFLTLKKRKQEYFHSSLAFYRKVRFFSTNNLLKSSTQTQTKQLFYIQYLPLVSTIHKIQYLIKIRGLKSPNFYLYKILLQYYHFVLQLFFLHNQHRGSMCINFWKPLVAIYSVNFSFGHRPTCSYSIFVVPHLTRSFFAASVGGCRGGVNKLYYVLAVGAIM